MLFFVLKKEQPSWTAVLTNSMAGINSVAETFELLWLNSAGNIKPHSAAPFSPTPLVRGRQRLSWNGSNLLKYSNEICMIPCVSKIWFCCASFSLFSPVSPLYQGVKCCCNFYFACRNWAAGITLLALYRTWLWLILNNCL